MSQNRVAARERRTYDQACGLANALDVVGERWTLLIIRELLQRPRRYNELLEALPGIGTNLLADRLSYLASAGVIVPMTPGRRPAGYALTDLGRTLHDPIRGLARFGLLAGAGMPHRPMSVYRASWSVLAIDAMLDDTRAPDVDETYQFDIDGEVFHVAVVAGHATTRPGPAADPTVAISTDAQTFFELGMHRLEPIEALVSGAVKVAGAASAVPRCLRLIGLGGGADAISSPQPGSAELAGAGAGGHSQVDRRHGPRRGPRRAEQRILSGARRRSRPADGAAE